MSVEQWVAQAAAAERERRFDDAVTHYRWAIAALAPTGMQAPRAALLNNLGGLLEQLDRTAEAIDCYCHATELTPARAEPHFNLGDALRRTDRAAEAVGPLRAAATLAPDLQEAWAALGGALLSLGQPDAALGALRRAVELKPEDDRSALALGDALQAIGRAAESVPCYERAVAHNPSAIDAWYGLGRALLETDQAGRAVAALERCNGHGIHWPALHDRSKALFQLGCVEQAMTGLRRAVADGPGDIRESALKNLAIIVPGSPADDNATVRQTRMEWARCLPGRTDRPPRRARGTGPLRVGYVSSFFHRPNWMKPVWALINRHDRTQVAVHLFSDAPADRAIGYRPDRRDTFHDMTGSSNEAVADAIRRAGVDVLVDLNGYSAPERLGIYTLRPAPLQVGWFNLYATSGLDCIDILIGDEHVIPPAEERYYTERIVRVPGSYLAFEVDHPVPDIGPPPVLREGRITIGCLASQYKITDDVVRTWADILTRCPAARLLIRNGSLGRVEHQDHLARRFAGHGIGRDRLILEGPADHHAFIDTYNRIDFAVDPFPYSGGTTTTEALWQGVPVVTFDGDRWASRTSVSLLRAAGLDEFVARDRAGYVELCERLATAAETPDRLQAFRAGARKRLRNSPACDTETLTRSLEAIYQRLWEEGGRT